MCPRSPTYSSHWNTHPCPMLSFAPCIHEHTQINVFDMESSQHIDNFQEYMNRWHQWADNDQPIQDIVMMGLESCRTSQRTNKETRTHHWERNLICISLHAWGWKQFSSSLPSKEFSSFLFDFNFSIQRIQLKMKLYV